MKNLLFGEYETFDTVYLNVNETSIYDGTILSDIININGYRPSVQHYNAGYIENHTSNELITFKDETVTFIEDVLNNVETYINTKGYLAQP